MQLIVLGMHRSGTSAVARLLNLMGASAGGPADLGAPANDNPKGFWERADVSALNERILVAGGGSWSDAQAFDPARIDENVRASLDDQVRSLVYRMDQFRPWFLKDPRMCVTFPFWRTALEVPVCVLPFRSPAAVASSLAARNDFDEGKSVALWEHYNRSALAHTDGVMRVFVDYDELIEHPVPSAQALWERLVAFGVALPRPPSAREVLAFIEPELRHHAGKVPTISKLSASQQALWSELRTQSRRRGIASGPAATDTHARTMQLVWDLRHELRDKQEQVEDLLRSMGAIEQRSQTLAHALEASRLRAGDENREHDLARLLSWMEELLCLNQATFASARWRVGDVTCRAIEKLLLRMRTPLARDRIEQLGKEYELWRATLQAPRGDGDLLGLPACGPMRASTGAIDATGSEEVAARVRNLPDVVVFPIIDWEFRIQRPQHLARELAGRGHRVFYLTTRPASGSSRAGFEVVDSPFPNVYVCRLHGTLQRHPNLYKERLRGSALADLETALDAMCDELSISEPVALVQLPFWRPLAERLPGPLMVYDCMDHHAGFSTNTGAMAREEQRLLAHAPLVLTTSDWLLRKIREQRTGATILVRNGAEVARFAAAKPRSSASAAGRPVVGYVGAISDWFDVDLVHAVAERCEDLDFVLFGAVTELDIVALEALPNVRLPGEIPYREVAARVAGFDVCVIPFRITELTLATNPVKVYEYLAAGKPVVATPMPEVVALPTGLVRIADSADAFVSALRQSLDERSDATLTERRRSFAAENDWAERAGTLEQAVTEAMPPVSVVVLCWNNVDFTRACLSSVDRFTGYPALELVLVDNGSTDGTLEYLKEFAAGRQDVQLIANDSNLGFARGNNVGIQAARGEFVVLLNNDTFVTPGWIGTMLDHFRRNPRLGALGPVTNNIGNEAKIDIAYANMENMRKQARTWTRRHAGRTMTSDVVAFFCAMFPRAVIESVGPLDESFGQGFFEDDDYCRRIRAAGFEIAIAEDVFVHHHLSASFAMLESAERKALFERNKSIFEDKWGEEWKPHRYRA